MTKSPASKSGLRDAALGDWAAFQGDGMACYRDLRNQDAGWPYQDKDYVRGMDRGREAVSVVLPESKPEAD